MQIFSSLVDQRTKLIQFIFSFHCMYAFYLIWLFKCNGGSNLKRVIMMKSEGKKSTTVRSWKRLWCYSDKLAGQDWPHDHAILLPIMITRCQTIIQEIINWKGREKKTGEMHFSTLLTVIPVLSFAHLRQDNKFRIFQAHQISCRIFCCF